VRTESISVNVSEACLERFSKFGRATHTGSFIMHNHDLVSDGFLTLTAASLVLLGSSLLAFAFN